MLARAMPRLVLGTWLVALAACLGAIGYLGWFTRYASDDYCTAGILLERGYLGAQAYWYSEWSGRFSFTALVSAFELLGVGVVRILPGLGLLAGTAAAAWALLPAARHARWPYPRLTSLALAELAVFGTCVATPNLGQSVLWQTGIITYLLPLILTCIFIGGLLRVLARPSGHHLPTRWLLAGVVLMWLAGGLSETTLTVQVVGLLIAAVLVAGLTRGPARQTGLALLAAGLVGSLLAAAVLALAPGNAERLEREAYPGGSLARVPIAVSGSFKLLYTFSRRFQGEFRPAFLACTVVPFLCAAWLATRASPAPNPPLVAARQFGRAMVSAAIGVLLMLATFFPSYWVLGFDPPARILLVSQCALVAGLIAGAYYLGRGVAVLLAASGPRRALVGALVSVALLGLAVVPAAEAAQQAREARTAAAYAMDWDRNDHLLRAAGESDADEVAVPSLPTWWGWDWVGPRTDDFPNQCVARYYGVDRVRSTS